MQKMRNILEYLYRFKKNQFYHTSYGYQWWQELIFNNTSKWIMNGGRTRIIIWVNDKTFFIPKDSMIIFFLTNEMV